MVVTIRDREQVGILGLLMSLNGLVNNKEKTQSKNPKLDPLLFVMVIYEWFIGLVAV
jgi:hypothetical protein